jgi:hypothetical protein
LDIEILSRVMHIFQSLSLLTLLIAVDGRNRGHLVQDKVTHLSTTLSKVALRDYTEVALRPNKFLQVSLVVRICKHNGRVVLLLKVATTLFHHCLDDRESLSYLGYTFGLVAGLKLDSVGRRCNMLELEFPLFAAGLLDFCL